MAQNVCTKRHVAKIFRCSVAQGYHLDSFTFKNRLMKSIEPDKYQVIRRIKSNVAMNSEDEWHAENVEDEWILLG